MPALATIELSGWPFDLAATLDSGQVFHWQPYADGFLGSYGDQLLYAAQPSPGQLTCIPGTEALIRHTFALDHDLPAIHATFPAADAHLARAIAYCPGLRIMRQPTWECLASFITSSLKQVPHIQKISHTLRQRYGADLLAQLPIALRTLAPSLPPTHTYPTPAVLCQAGESALRACGLGYRAAFLHRTAHAISYHHHDLTIVDTLPDPAALAHLTQLHGVGEKIASCALLFGWGRLAAFPVDVWVQRIIHQLYFPRARQLSPQRLRAFIPRHFGPYAGYAQQFLFHWARRGRGLSQPPPPPRS